MPSPMDECDHLSNIEPISTNDTSVLKRRLDASNEELSFPCKKIAVSPVEKLSVPDVTTLPTPMKTATIQPKLTKAERDALKMEKAKEREAERQKKEQERQKREEERLKKEEERLRKVLSSTTSC
jgi:hypothetical protein